MSLVHIRNFTHSYSITEWSEHWFFKACFTSKRNSWARGPKALFASWVLQKAPIKPFSNSFFQPWTAEMAEDVRVRVSKAAKQWLTHQVWDSSLSLSPLCSWLVLSPGGSFSVLHFAEEKQILFSCMCSLMVRMFKAHVGSLEGVGVQRSFPPVRN